MPLMRLLPFAEADGPTHMAADEVMLETAAERGIASLRFYTWSEPTLSLGYFQPASCREHSPDYGRLPWVRRSTGGAAIVHQRELTYAIALPEGKPWQTGESWICRFHHTVRELLESAGFMPRLVLCGEERRLGDVLCFLHQTPGDLLMAGSKIAGSAQRKRKGALLQHGSILLARSEFAPMLPGINDLAGRELWAPRRLAEVIASRYPIESAPWSPEETHRIVELFTQKYACPAWNHKR